MGVVVRYLMAVVVLLCVAWLMRRLLSRQQRFAVHQTVVLLAKILLGVSVLWLIVQWFSQA